MDELIKILTEMTEALTEILPLEQEKFRAVQEDKVGILDGCMGREQAFALRRDAQAAHVTVEEHRIQLLFQLPYLPTDGGWIAVHELRRLAHAARARGVVEAAQLLKKVAAQFFDHAVSPGGGKGCSGFVRPGGGRAFSLPQLV